MTYSHLQADCLYTGMGSGPNASMESPYFFREEQRVTLNRRPVTKTERILKGRKLA